MVSLKKRMTVVGECNLVSHRRSKFQKIPLEQNSQVDELQRDVALENV